MRDIGFEYFGFDRKIQRERLKRVSLFFLGGVLFVLMGN